MFGPDPIDLGDPSPYLALAYYGHILIGTLTLLVALVAFATLKGSALHRYAGYAFGAGVLIVCITSIDMLREVFIPPLFMAVFTAIYAFGGAWLALQRRSRAVLLSELGLTLFEIVGLIIFLSIAVPAARAGLIPPFAPLVIALIPIILLVGDANWFLQQKSRARLRIARHLSRMIWAFAVVLRAPLVELAAAGLPLSQGVVTFGPMGVAVLMLWYFRRKYVRPSPR